MKQVVAKGIILARTDFGEADRILTILTLDEGKIRAIAKGVRKVKSKLAGGIELFSISQISFIRGKSDINTLTSTRLEKHFGHIVKDINRTMFAYQVLKHINRVTEDNAEPEYFHLLKETLEVLDDIKIDQTVIQFWLNIQLLKIAGHSPNLQTDTEGQKLSTNQNYNFDVSKMSFAPAAKGSYNQQHIKFLRLGLGLDSPKPLAQIIDLDTVLPAGLQLSKIMHKQFEHI